jgi:small subunit ribosomal protein S4
MTAPEWIEADRDKLTGKISRVPSKEEIAPIVNEQMIVEFYSR